MKRHYTIVGEPGFWNKVAEDSQYSNGVIHRWCIMVNGHKRVIVPDTLVNPIS